MIIKKFRVTNFRSIMDSNWVDCSDVTAIAGENESGKTNLFLALLKFGKQSLIEDDKKSNIESKTLSKLDILNDPPYKIKEKVHANPSRFTFCTVAYDTQYDPIHDELKALYSEYVPVNEMVISKNYNENYSISAISAFPKELKAEAEEIILRSLPIFMYFKEVNEFGNDINLLSISSKIAFMKDKEFSQEEYMYYNLLMCLDIWENNLIKSAKEAYGYFDESIKNEYDFAYILDKVPLLKRRIDKGFEKVNKEFVYWWGEADIELAYEPYKKGIKIFVNENGTKIALENRSTGFKRFFSLFLSFSMAQKNALNNAVLLFDEAGAALHPLTQEKLEKFFIELSKTVQLMYNTHTSFMLSIGHLDNARVVYKDSNNYTTVKNNLVINDDRSNEYSLFAPHTSLSLYVAAKQMSGCRPTLVLNESDEIYLGLTKTVLQTLGKIHYPYNLLVFATGLGGIKAVSDIFSSNDGEPPFVCLSRENLRTNVKDKLIQETFANHKDKIITIESTKHIDVETFEDLFPTEFIAISAKMYLAKFFGNTFEPNVKKKFLPQVLARAEKMNVNLPENFRSEIAKRCKLSYMRNYNSVKFKSKNIDLWLSLWNIIASKKSNQSVFIDGALVKKLNDCKTQKQITTIVNNTEIKSNLASKNSINAYIAAKHKKTVVSNSRPNRTKTNLLLADTYYIKNEYLKDTHKDSLKDKLDGEEVKDFCYMYVYELENNKVFILFNTTLEYAKKLCAAGKQIYKSKFPKNGNFYNIIIDNTFKKPAEVNQFMDDIINILIGKK